MPTSATCPSGFFSTISCAIRTSVRRMSSSSRTTLGWVIPVPSWPHGAGLKGLRRNLAAPGRRQGSRGPRRGARAAAPGPSRSRSASSRSWCSAMRSSDQRGLSWITNSRISPASASYARRIRGLPGGVRRARGGPRRAPRRRRSTAGRAARRRRPSAAPRRGRPSAAARRGARARAARPRAPARCAARTAGRGRPRPRLATRAPRFGSIATSPSAASARSAARSEWRATP